jgi:hypothetical protein
MSMGSKFYMKVKGLVGPIDYDGSKSWFELRSVALRVEMPSKQDAPTPGTAVAEKEMVDGGWQLISQSLSTGPKDVTIVWVRPDDRSEYKVSGELGRYVLQGAKIVGTPTWTYKENSHQERYPERFFNFMTFVLTSPRAWIVRGTGPTGPAGHEWSSLRATSLFHGSATA